MVLWLSDPFFRLEETFRDTGFDQNTVQNSGNKQIFFEGIRELTARLEEGFAKVLARDTVLANKPVFWIEMTEILDAESVVKKEGEMQD